MTQVIYKTATTINGFLADENQSLWWLFAVPEETDPGLAEFAEGIGAIVMGSTTYQWVLDAEDVLAHPERWADLDFLSALPVFVFTSRLLPIPEGADVRLVGGAVALAMPQLLAGAAGRDVWVMGGGDLAGQFLDAGLLDAIHVDIAPAMLPAGAPLFPRRLGPDRLRLRGVERRGQFVQAVYDVTPVPAG